MIKRIVIVTDCKDVAFSEMKWSIENSYDGIDWKGLSIDLVPVEEFSIANAAFLTRLTGELCGEETLIWVVINPQKHRSDRIFGRTKGGLQFFGANTGALTWLLRDQGVEELYRIDEPGFFTFGGKFVHSPNVAKIISGEPMSTLGSELPEASLEDFVPTPGQVVHIDNFGLLKVYGEKIDFTDGDIFKIYLNS
ncbi:MAG: SAM-dependent chlorinase/fluorinase [Cyanobacteria bacterium P01_H01_bin.15]